MPYNLSLPKAIEHLESVEDELTYSKELQDGVDSDTAFILGYQTAIYELKKVTGDDPMEVFVVKVTIPEEETK